MLIAFWSVKGGSGVTVVAAGAALALARPSAPPVLLVDMAGDLAYCLGVPDPSGPGVADWSAAGSDVPADALVRLATPVTSEVELIPRGSGPIDAGRADLLLQLLSAARRDVVIDCGLVDEHDAAAAAAVVAAGAERSVLVTRMCALGLRRAVRASLRPMGVVAVREAGRALTSEDVANVLGVPVLAEVAVDPAVARAVDAGLLATRPPRQFSAALRQVAA